MKAEDQLMDALLKEQAKKREADEALLAGIDAALDGEPEKKVSKWRRAMPLSIAALLAMTAAGVFMRQKDFAPELAVNEKEESRAVRSPGELMAMRDSIETRDEMVSIPESLNEEPALRRSKGDAGHSDPSVADRDLFTAPSVLFANRDESLTSVPSAEPPASKVRAERELASGDALALAAESPAAQALPSELATREGKLFAPKPPLFAEPDEIAEESVPPAPASRSAGVIAANTAAPLEVPVPSADMAVPNAEYGASNDFGDGWNGSQQDRGGNRQLATRSKGASPVDESAALRLSERKVGRRPMVPEKHEGLAAPVDSTVGGTVNPSRDHYSRLVDQPWKSAWDEALSTFSIDVDTASYTNLRRMIREGRSIQPDAVRIEECINYFDYHYPEPEGDSPFRVQSVLASCPWKSDHLLARVSIKGREIGKNARPASNLVFLIDVSGSMQSPDKLPMLKRAMKLLIDELDERDRVGMVVYAGTEGVVLPPTRLDEVGKSKAIAALAKLEAGGSTNGGAGLKRAYQMALENMQAEGVNRVILASDGDFNVGTTGQGELVGLVKERAAKGVSLSVLGFGTGNLNDAMMEAVTNDGNGNYFYVGSDREAKRVFVDKLGGTLVTIAKDVKIQVEFNPGKVKAYRLIGYANRVLRNQDFNNDKVDAGDIGAGHTVTAFYEIVPVGVDAPGVGNVDEFRYQRLEGRRELVESADWFTLKLRYKHPEGDKSQLIETPVRNDAVDWKEAGNDFRMASAAALFGMKLRKMEDVSEVNWDQVIEIAKPTLAEDPQEQRAEFVELLKKLK